jgi:hypothetical protein
MLMLMTVLVAVGLSDCCDCEKRRNGNDGGLHDEEFFVYKRGRRIGREVISENRVVLLGIGIGIANGSLYKKSW